MRLSEAMDLGRTLEPMNMLSYQHCALGVGMAAVGVPVDKRSSQELVRQWPWLGELATQTFGDLHWCGWEWYMEISRGAIMIQEYPGWGLTLDGLISFVRSIEPQEDSQQGKEEKNEYTEVAIYQNVGVLQNG